METTDLFTELQNQLERTGRFIPAAFHVHSIGSYDWANRVGVDEKLNAKSRFQDENGIQVFLDELAKHFEIVCITDHMKCEYACEVSKASLRRADILALPAMEVSCSINPFPHIIHLLAVFPPGTDAAAFEKLFTVEAKFPTENKRSGKERIAIPDLKLWIDRVKTEGGLVIFAHIQADAGHRQVIRAALEKTLRSFLLDSDLVTRDGQREVAESYATLLADCRPNAVEIMNPDDKVHYVDFEYDGGKSCRMACVVRSDFHCIEELAPPESRTYLKVARRDFDAVRDAVTFFETRVRFHHDLPQPSYPRIVGVALLSPSKEGLFEKAVIAFNQNLNCLIGPRGSGKSTIIEAMRYALGANADFARKDEWATDQPADIAQQIQAANLNGTLIKLVYETDENEYYTLSVTYDRRAEMATVEVLDKDGSAVPVDPAALPAKFPARVYSWSQIESLGRRPESQRALVDRLIPDVESLLMTRKERYGQLSENRADILSVTARMSNKLEEQNGLAKRYTEFKSEFERINDATVARLFENLDCARERSAALQAAIVHIESFAAQLAELDLQNLAGFDPAFETTQDALIQWWETQVEPAAEFTELAVEIEQHLSSIRNLAAQRLQRLKELLARETSAAEESEAQIRAQTRADAEAEISRDRREQARSRYQIAARLREEYLAYEEQLSSWLSDRETILTEIEDIQENIAERRASSKELLVSRLSELPGVELDIEISFTKGGDRQAMIDYMEAGQFLKREFAGQYKNTNYAVRLCAMATPINIGRALLTEDRGRLEQEGMKCDQDQGLSTEEAARLISQYRAIANDAGVDARVVDAGKLETILRLQEVPWSDVVSILLDKEPVDKKSPGQRSSAMLPLVALSETAPLIIDQPEDNLDNRLIGQVLTQVLARLKETRQIIVATHSPNIVVGGDAEQVVVLDADGLYSARVVTTGSIDDRTIVESVVSIMEGGKEAFEARGKRYEKYLSS